MSFCKRFCCVEEKVKTIEYMLSQYKLTVVQYNTLKNAGITDEYIEVISESKQIFGSQLYDYLLRKREEIVHKTIIRKNNQQSFNRTFTQM